MASLDDKSPFKDAVLKKVGTSASLGVTVADGDSTIPLVIGFDIEDQPSPQLLDDLGK